MANSSQQILYDAHHTVSLRHVYFLLAAAGAAIGLIVNETQSVGLSISQIPLGLAVVSLGMSFLFGCLYVENNKEIIRLNSLFLLVESDQLPWTSNNPQMKRYALTDTNTHVDTALARFRFNGVWQFRCLILGGVLYLVWHIWQMYLRTKGI
jgi:hypothetical protein